MEPRKFKLEDHQPERELFRVDERYFENLPVKTADRIHSRTTQPGRKWFPVLATAIGMASIIGLFIFLFFPGRIEPDKYGQAGVPEDQASSQDIYQVMVHDEEFEFAPTEDELIDQLSKLEDDSDKKAIQDFLEDGEMLYENDIFEEI